MKESLGELLIKENFINLKQLEQAREKQKEHGNRLISSLVHGGFIKEDIILEFLGRHFKLPTVDLNSFEINPESVKLIPQKFCERHVIIPISVVGRSLVVAFFDPTHLFIKDDIGVISRKKIEIVLATERAIRKAIEKHFGVTHDLFSMASKIEEKIEISPSEVKDDIVQLAKIHEGEAESSPIINFVNTLLQEAISKRASDIHVEPYEKRFRIRFRIDGILHEKTQPPQGSAIAIVSRLKVLCRMNITERRRPQDGRLKVRTSNGSEIDFRVNSIPTLFGEKMVLRILDKSNLKVDLTQLGFEPQEMKLFKRIIHQPQGMVLVTGPTGSGKTTTLYSAIQDLNHPNKNISTAEDPVEFNIDGINQVQINSEIKFSFSDALRSFLRQDPEIIMVGEIRDRETAEIAFKAASTGHMVVSTLHTNDAPSTITRLIDMGIAPYIVAESTSLVVAQRLIKRVCSSCTVDQEIDPEVLRDVGVEENDLKNFKKIKVGEGCSACNGTGLRGRVAIFELMQLSSHIKDGIFKSVSTSELKQISIHKGKMKTLRQSALLKLKKGETSLEEVINSTLGDKIE